MSDQAKRTNQELIGIIKRTEVDTNYLYDYDNLADEKIRFLARECAKVLDIGKSSRKKYDYFSEGQILTMDINQYEGYPDIVDDICDIRNIEWESLDGIVCLSILEHVYAPHLAVENLYRLLKKGGYCFVQTPFLWRYHGSGDLMLQDYFRFSRDGLAYLFRNFSEVTIYPIRGNYSTIFNMFGFWKYKVEKVFGLGVNKIIDKSFGLFSKRPEKVVQASGYYLWARK